MGSPRRGARASAQSSPPRPPGVEPQGRGAGPVRSRPRPTGRAEGRRCRTRPAPDATPDGKRTTSATSNMASTYGTTRGHLDSSRVIRPGSRTARHGATGRETGPARKATRGRQGRRGGHRCAGTGSGTDRLCRLRRRAREHRAGDLEPRQDRTGRPRHAGRTPGGAGTGPRNGPKRAPQDRAREAASVSPRPMTASDVTR